MVFGESKKDGLINLVVLVVFEWQVNCATCPLVLLPSASPIRISVLPLNIFAPTPAPVLLTPIFILKQTNILLEVADGVMFIDIAVWYWLVLLYDETAVFDAETT